MAGLVWLYNKGGWNFRDVATDVFGNALGNAVVGALTPKSVSGALSPETQRELEQAEQSGQVSAELARKVVEETSRGLSFGVKGSTLKVTDGKTDWGGDLNEMDSYNDLMIARRSLLGEFDMGSDTGRAINLSLMQMQAKQIRESQNTEESAAYLQGLAKGEARYNHQNRNSIAAQQRQRETARQLDAMNHQTWVYEQANKFDLIDSLRGLSQRLEVQKGVIATQNSTAYNEMLSPTNSTVERGIYGLFYAGTVLLAGAEEGARGILNIPSFVFGALPKAEDAGVNVAIALDERQPVYERVDNGLKAIINITDAFLGLGAFVAGPPTRADFGSPKLSEPTFVKDSVVLNNINPQLSSRLELYRAWKADNQIVGQPSRSEFSLFENPERAQTNFKKNYSSKSVEMHGEWPPNFGALGESSRFILIPGTRIDRFGSDFGSFLSPVGTPYGDRALRPGTLRAPYSVFEVTSPLEVDAAIIRPWFGEAGRGEQYKLINALKVNDVLGNQLKEIYRGPYRGYNK